MNHIVKTESVVEGHEIVSYAIEAVPTQTNYTNFDKPLFGSDLYVNIVRLQDRQVRIYTRPANLAVLVKRKEMLEACLEEAMKYTNDGSPNDIYSRSSLGTLIAVNFYPQVGNVP